MSDVTAHPQEIIRRKRDGEALSEAEIAAFVRALTDGTASEGQVAAFAMAVVLRGMRPAECAALTAAMAGSGSTIDWSDLALPGPVLDKHSTGGVGDTVSLMLAPLVAACGGFVPMISGRGLGHAGGTLDKLDSIPGYDTAPNLARLRRTVAAVGCAIIGQTADLAPADRRLYAIRDVTATVESIPLITASILSKKLAAGLQGLVMDVKFGSGAYLPEVEAARELAESIASVAAAAGLRTVALLTDMNQPLGWNAGHALEVRAAIDWLAGGRTQSRLGAVTLALGAEMLVLGGLAPDVEEAHRRLAAARDKGEAAERFQRMVAALGGPAELVEKPQKHLAAAPVQRDAAPAQSGIVQAIDVRQVGLAVAMLGGGRRRVEDRIDHRVGFSDLLGIGDETGRHHPLALIHAADEESAAAAAARLAAAYTVGEAPAAPGPLIGERIAPT